MDLSVGPQIATPAPAPQDVGGERCQLRLRWRDVAGPRRFSEALLSLFGPAAAQIEVPSPIGWRPVELDEAARRLSAGPTALRFQLGSTSIESSDDGTSLIIGRGPLTQGPADLTWLQADPVLRSPLPFLAVPLLDDTLRVDLLHSLVALAHRCAPLDQAEASLDDAPLRWSATEPGQPLVATAHGAHWHPAADGSEDAIRFLAKPFALPDLPAALRAAVDLESKAVALADAVPCAIRLVALDGAPATFHVPPPADAILRLVPQDDAVHVEVDTTLDPQRSLWTLCHAAAHLRLGHVRPGDTHGHWDTWESITTPGRRWDRETRDRLPTWAPPSAPTRASLDECTPQEKAWLVLLDHIGRMVGEARSLHPAAEHYQAAAYQRQAAQRLVAQLEDYGGAMLCDGVGLGKTYVATTVLVHYANAWRERLAQQSRSLADDPFRVTILSPNSVVTTWQREAIPPLGAHGVVPAHVRVVSHTKLSRIESSSAALKRAGGELADFEHLLLSDLVIVDEAHNFRSVSARRTVVLRDLLRLQPRNDLRRKVLLLTATPVNNSLEDLRQEISLLFCRPLFFNNNLTAEGYRQRAPRDVEERVAKARRSTGEVSAVLIHGTADAKFSYALGFRNDLKLGVKVEDIPEYLKEQEKRLALVQAATKASMKANQPPPAEPVRVAADLLDRIVVQRSRALCKQIEREQGSDVRLLFRPDSGPPKRLVYEDEYDGESDVLARFLPLFATGEVAAAAMRPPLSLKVYMWADVRDGVANADESSPVVGLQRILVLKRLESSPVSFLITVLRLLALHAFRLRQLSNHAHDLVERARAAELDGQVASILRPQAGRTHDDLARLDLLLTGGNATQEGRDLLKRWGDAHLGVKPEAVGEDLPATQLGMFARAIDDEVTAARKEQFDSLWALKDDLVRDFETLLGVAPGLAGIVFGRFAREDWPRRFCAKGAVVWPDSATWGRRIVSDAKIRRLVGQLLAGRSEGQKIVVFSQFTDTLAYIFSVFSATGRLERADWPLVLAAFSAEVGRSVNASEVKALLAATRTVTGETEDRDTLIDSFAPFYRIGPRAPTPYGAEPGEQGSLLNLWRVSWTVAMRDPVDVLLASDVLAEGVNLQDAALLVNYDVHWNPVRMIQRAGRIDRRLNPAIEDATSFPELESLARELDRPSPTYWWHGRPEGVPTTVNLLLSDELEAQLALRERIANKTLAIDFTLGLEQGTGAEAEWMSGYRYQGISALNAWQRERAIEQVAGYQERIRRLLSERTIDTAWVEQWNGWLKETAAAADCPLLGWGSASVGTSARTGTRFLKPILSEGATNWLWSPVKPKPDSALNEWIVLDGKTSPALTRRDLPWTEDASRPVTPDDLMAVARRLVDDPPAMEERGRDVGKLVFQGLPAVLAGFFSQPSDRKALRIAGFRFLQIQLNPPPRQGVPESSC